MTHFSTAAVIALLEMLVLLSVEIFMDARSGGCILTALGKDLLKADRAPSDSDIIHLLTRFNPQRSKICDPVLIVADGRKKFRRVQTRSCDWRCKNAVGKMNRERAGSATILIRRP